MLKIFAFALNTSLLLVSISGSVDANMKLNIPYRPDEVSHCYERIKQAKPVFQNALKSMQSILESDGSFQDRMKKAMDVHTGAIKESSKDPANTTFVEEDIYLCCVYDMVEAAFAMETEKVINTADDSKKKHKQLDQLLSAVESLPFKSPQYQTVLRPRLEKKIAQAKDQL